MLGSRAIINFTTAGIALITLLLLQKAKRLPEPVLIVLAGVASLLLFRGS